MKEGREVDWEGGRKVEEKRKEGGTEGGRKQKAFYCYQSLTWVQKSASQSKLNRDSTLQLFLKILSFSLLSSVSVIFTSHTISLMMLL